MKRQVLLLVCLSIAIMTSYAQIQTATLEQDNTLKMFYGENAFKEAYEAAKDGAVITLSAGNFSSVEKISKSIAIIGSGWSGQNYTGFNTPVMYKTRTHNSLCHFAIEANNVRLEGLNLSRSIYIGSSYNSSNVISNLQIKNCFIGEFYGYNWKYKNTTIDQSIIYIFYTTGNSEHLCIKNSKIQSFEGNCYNRNDVVYITNCFIPTWYYSIYSNSTSCPYAVYKNCILGSLIKSNDSNTGSYYYEGYYTPINNGGGEFYNNVFYVYPFEYTQGDYATYSA